MSLQYLTFPLEKSEMVPFSSSRMKNIVVFPAQSRFPVKLFCCVAFGSGSSSCCLSKSIDIISQYLLK